MKVLKVLRAPLGISLQDSGRVSKLRYGVSEAGPMDWAHHAMANVMLGKCVDDTVIEVGPAGMDIMLEEGELQLSFAGPGFRLNLSENNYSGPRRFILRGGQQLSIRPRAGAMWGYLGVQGSFDIPRVLGSHSENSVSGIHALKISSGSCVPVLERNALSPVTQQYVDPYIAYKNQPLGILPSSQFADFSSSMQDQLVKSVLSIGPRYNRMAYQLLGVEIKCRKGHDILSDGITMGAIQVPGDGRPFVLMADHQATGGYPKIACVCKADLPRMAQISPERFFTFEWLTLDQAMARWRTIKKQISFMTALRGI